MKPVPPKTLISLTVCMVLLSIAPVLTTRAAEPGSESEYSHMIEFGSVSMDSEDVRSVFAISNTRNKTLKFKSARCPSRCVQILSYPAEILPDKSGDIEFRWIPSRPGEMHCEILLETGDSPPGLFRYALKGNIEGKTLPGRKTQTRPKIPPELITRKLRKRDPALAISVESVLLKLKGKEDIVLMDVRPHQNFEKFRIPGSINIAPYAIKTKTFLKSKPLVLVNEGYRYSRLEQLCRQLNGVGFKQAFVLTGGLSAWSHKGAPIEGDVFAQRELSRMPSRVFFEERNDEGWLVVDISGSRNPEVRYLIPHATAVPFEEGARKFVSALRMTLGRHEGNTPPFVLIFNEKGEGYESVEKLIDQTDISYVFYLKDGFEGYRLFLRKQALMLDPGDHTRSTIKKCAECP